MVRKGYSKNIDDMDIMEYDFIMDLMMELNRMNKDQSLFSGGL